MRTGFWYAQYKDTNSEFTLSQDRIVCEKVLDMKQKKLADDFIALCHASSAWVDYLHPASCRIPEFFMKPAIYLELRGFKDLFSGGELILAGYW